MPKPFPVRTVALALAATLLAGAAGAVQLTVGSYARTGIGAEFESPYDNLFIDGRSFDVAFVGPAPMSLTLADVTFEVGPNCYACSLRPSFDALIAVSLGGVTRQLDLPYAWSSTGPTDSVAFATPAPIRFDLADRSVLLSVASPDVLSSSGGAMHGRLDATLTVTAIPEPSAWMLTLAGLGLVAWIGRRRA